jgi:hypothetical protein
MDQTSNPFQTDLNVLRRTAPLHMRTNSPNQQNYHYRRFLVGQITKIYFCKKYYNNYIISK